MNKARVNRRRKELISHRIAQYEKSLDGVISGKLPPEYMSTRWQKLKPLVKKSK